MTHLTDRDIVAIHEPLRQRPERAARLQRRIERAARTVADVADGQHFGSVILATRLLIQRLIGEGWIVLHGGSAFDRASERLSSAIEAHAEPGAIDAPERRGEADRLAREMRRRLGAEGYYVAIRQPAEVAG